MVQVMVVGVGGGFKGGVVLGEGFTHLIILTFGKENLSEDMLPTFED